MTALEIVLLLCGVVCVVISFVMGDVMSSKESEKEPAAQVLTEANMQKLNEQLDSAIEDKVQIALEKTEVSLDKISNTKILEMNEYAENILGQINRNHNETVFLYDMLNEKAKEVKTTVKDVNVTKRQVERIQAEVAADVRESKNEQNTAVKTDSELNKEKEAANRAETVLKEDKPKQDFRAMTPQLVKETQPQAQTQSKPRRTSRSSSSAAKAGAEPQAPASGNVAKDRLRKVVAKDEEALKKQDNKTTVNEADDKLSEEDRMDAAIRKAATGKTARTKSSTSRRTTKKTAVKAEPPEEVTEMNIQFDGAVNNNEKILRLYRDGKSNKDIAKELNLGVGEVKLVIDLYNNTK